MKNEDKDINKTNKVNSYLFKRLITYGTGLFWNTEVLILTCDIVVELRRFL